MIHQVKTRNEFTGIGFKLSIEYVENLCDVIIETAADEISLTLKQKPDTLDEIASEESTLPKDNISMAERKKLRAQSQSS